MIQRNELDRFLADLYQYPNYQDFCHNGLQVEGKEQISKIVFGVSFHLPFLEQAIREGADAIIVHHGIFQQGFFQLTGTLKQKIQLLLVKHVSLFGIHLPMDGHRELGHNALLMKALGAENCIPLDFGYQGDNSQQHHLAAILKILHHELHGGESKAISIAHTPLDEIFGITTPYGFTVLANGPEVPKRLAVISGEASSYLEKAVALGIDTFLCGDIKERIPAISLENRVNFINLGHYYSEKPGVIALMHHIERNFQVETQFVDIPNPV